MAASEYLTAVREMTSLVDDQIETVQYRGQDRLVLPLQAALVGEGSGYWLYECRVPVDADVTEDSPVTVAAGTARAGGRVIRMSGERCTVAVDQPLGSRIEDGWLTVDGTDVLESLRARLTSLRNDAAGTDVASAEHALLTLSPSGGRLQDSIATAADSTDRWKLDDRESDVLQSALRYQHAFVQEPPGADPAEFVARLLDQLLRLDATVLFAGASSAIVDSAVLSLCTHLPRGARLRSGVVQRIGPIGVPELATRFGAMIDPEEIADDLRAGLDQRLSALDLEDLRLNYLGAVSRADEVQSMYNDLLDRIDRARDRRRLVRLRTQDNPDELLVHLHKMRPGLKSVRGARDQLAADLAAADNAAERAKLVTQLLGEPPAAEGTNGAVAMRRAQVAEVRAELEAAHGEIAAALRQRCRLAATTVGQAIMQPLPRRAFDVVVLAGPVSAPAAFLLGGFATRSVIRLGDPDRLHGIGYHSLPALRDHRQATGAPPTHTRGTRLRAMRRGARRSTRRDA